MANVRLNIDAVGEWRYRHVRFWWRGFVDEVKSEVTCKQTVFSRQQSVALQLSANGLWSAEDASATACFTVTLRPPVVHRVGLRISWRGCNGEGRAPGPNPSDRPLKALLDEKPK